MLYKIRIFKFIHVYNIWIMFDEANTYFAGYVFQNMDLNPLIPITKYGFE